MVAVGDSASVQGGAAGPAHGFCGPVSVYDNWSSFNTAPVELDEKLALAQVDEVLRLREHGVRFDCFMMDDLWFEPGGGYRRWRKPQWLNGGEGWIERCLAHGVKPGLWFSFAGAFRDRSLGDLMGAMQDWYDRGVRAFKLDFVDFDEAPEGGDSRDHSENRRQNVQLLTKALCLFRQRNSQVLLMGYNGLGGEPAGTSLPFRKTVDTAWLDVFDSLYCGDPRIADVPTMSFWRSMDMYSCHMVRQYEFNGLPLARIDNAAFMIGKTGACYSRRTTAWKGMLILSLARGGWVNVYYGNLEYLDAENAEWFAKVQSMFLEMQAAGHTHSFGGLPGKAQPYGWASTGPDGALCTVVNPSQAFADVTLPTTEQFGVSRVIFSDAGVQPPLSGGALTLGPEQMAVVGFGKYSQLDLGVQEDIVVPRSIEAVAAEIDPVSRTEAIARLYPPAGADLRIIMRQLKPDGLALRTSGRLFDDENLSLGTILRLAASQNGRQLPIRINYDRPVWSGLSWAAGEIGSSDLDPDMPLEVTCGTKDTRELVLECKLYAVHY